MVTNNIVQALFSWKQYFQWFSPCCVHVQHSDDWMGNEQKIKGAEEAEQKETKLLRKSEIKIEKWTNSGI